MSIYIFKIIKRIKKLKTNLKRGDQFKTNKKLKKKSNMSLF